MPRTPSIRYFDSRQAYYTQFRGQQHLLAAGPKDEPDGPTYQEAVRRFAEVMHMGEEARTDTATLGGILTSYRRHLAAHERERTAKLVRTCLRWLEAVYGAVRVRDLRLHHVQAWLDHHRDWSPTTRLVSVGKLQAALSWAAAQGYTRRVEIAWRKLGLPRPSACTRGRDHVIAPEHHTALIAAAPPALRDLLTFLEATGCRPAEAYNAAVRYYDPARRAFVYPHSARPPDFVHKTAQRTGKDRVLYLPATLLPRVEELMRRHDTGPILRNAKGHEWNSSAVHHSLRKLRKRVPGVKVIPYSYRHTFATRWLLAGGSIKILAELLGTSVVMLERHYGHLDADPAAMLRVLDGFRPAQ